MKGRRVFPDADGHLTFAPGDYGRHQNGQWMACTPNGLLGNLDSHEVIENADLTITVSPSILVENYDGTRWHGYLEHGVWREV